MPSDKEATCPSCNTKPGTCETVKIDLGNGRSSNRAMIVCRPCRMYWTCDTGWKPLKAAKE